MLGLQILLESELFMVEVIPLQFSSNCPIQNRKFDRLHKFHGSGILVLLELMDKVVAIKCRQLCRPSPLLWVHSSLLDDSIYSSAMEIEVGSYLRNLNPISVKLSDFRADEIIFSLSLHYFDSQEE